MNENVNAPSGKRYYWLKLRDDFFNSKRIKKLRRLAGGDTYTIIYLKMQLLAMKTNGILRWTGLEDDFASELALDLDEAPDNVAVTLRFLLSYGLAETDDNTSFFFPYAVENTGSETASAQRVRDFRARQRELQCNTKALQSNTDVTQVKRECSVEKEIELEKESEIERDIEPEKKKEIENPLSEKEDKVKGVQGGTPAPPPAGVLSGRAREERVNQLAHYVESFTRLHFDPSCWYRMAENEGIRPEEITPKKGAQP